MTDIKKTAEDNAPAKGRKLPLNKETLKDLGPDNPSQVKGGNRYNPCTAGYSGAGRHGLRVSRRGRPGFHATLWSQRREIFFKPHAGFMARFSALTVRKTSNRNTP